MQEEYAQVCQYEPFWAYDIAKYFRHEDPKTQRLILAKCFALCPGAFVAIYSPQSL
jgi:hypothetical protein